MIKMLKHLRKYWLRYLIGIVLYFGFIFYLISLSQDNFNVSYDGYLIRLGDGTDNQNVTLELNGRRSRTILGRGRFKGKMKFMDEEIDIDFELDSENKASLGGYNSDWDYIIIGNIYADNKLENVTIAVYEKSDHNSWAWNSESGLVYSYPAETRDEAYTVYKVLTEKSMIR